MTENVTTEDPIIKTITEKEKILSDVLNFVNIEFKSIENLVGMEVDRKILLKESVVEDFKNYQIKLKEQGFKSGKLTSLHKNSMLKQQFPAINMLRQLLKCHDLWLKPKIVCLGYNKSTGSKIIKRSFVITLLDKK